MLTANRLKKTAWARGVGGVPTDNLVAYYKMDSLTSDVVVDELGNHNGVTNGGPSLTTGFIGSALNFTSYPSYIDLGSNFFSSAPSFLIALKIKLPNSPGSASKRFEVISMPSVTGATGFDTFCQMRQGGEIRWGVRNAAGTRVYFDAFYTLYDSLWHTLMLGYDGANIFVNYDDVETVGPALTGAVTDGGVTTRMGQPNSLSGLDSNGQYYGVKDHMRIYDVCPSRSERTLIAEES